MPQRRERSLRWLAIALATTCFVIGIPLCAIGVAVLPTVTGLNDPELARCVALIVAGGIFCFAGMQFKRG